MNNPKFALYHPNGKGTGCALAIELHPARLNEDGYIDLTMAKQKSMIEHTENGMVLPPTFGWDRALAARLDFATICKMLQVFRGECETLECGKGVYIRRCDRYQIVNLRHRVDPVQGYDLSLCEGGKAAQNDLADVEERRILLNTWEALGLSLALENSMGLVCFGEMKEDNQ